MDIVTLRKKTRKALIGWGKYKDYTVEQLITALPQEIVWLYYHVEWMTFTDDILDEVKIFEHERIEKPGIDQEMFEKRLNNFIRSRYKNKDIANFVVAAKEKKRRRRALQIVEESVNFTKGQLQAMNHGHMRHDS